MKVNGKHYRPVWIKEDNSEIIQIIDQRSLPHGFVIEDLTNTDELAMAIQEMHVSCLAAIPNASLLEIHAFRIDDFLIHQLEIKDGFAFASDRIGHGVVIDWEKMASHQIV